MTSPFSFHRRRLLFFLFLLPILAFPVAFLTAYQGDAVRVMSLGQLAWAHLSYAEELKDDMAVIDWSKNLERLEDVRAFQVALNSKVVAQGGNIKYIPAKPAPGVSFLYPSDWSFQSTSNQGPLSSLQFTAVFHSWPGPFFWGVFASLLCGGTGMILVFLSPSASASAAPRTDILYGPADRPSNPAPVSSFQDHPFPSNPWKGSQSCLFIDKTYVIRQVSPEVAGLLLKKAEELQDGHLLDLAPDAILLQAFENGVEAKILKPFPGHPHISATLKPDSNGYWLILEGANQV